MLVPMLRTYGLEYILAIIGVCWLLLQVPPEPNYPYQRRVWSIVLFGIVLICLVVFLPMSR